LGDAFGVGRTTVREALHGLVASGFLERRSNQLFVRDRTQIPEHDVNYAEMAARISVEDLYETRKTIEGKAVELAARNWADNDITNLRAALNAMRTVSDADFHAADVEFHTTVVRLGKNAVLTQVYEDSKNLFFKLPGFWRLFAPSGSPSRPITGWEGHRHIVDAIERRDAPEAVRLNNEMLDRVKNTLIERMNRAQQAASTDPSGGKI
jgi:DNA-binding FadR family transcriptional regulator